MDSTQNQIKIEIDLGYEKKTLILLENENP